LRNEQIKEEEKQQVINRILKESSRFTRKKLREETNANLKPKRDGPCIKYYSSQAASILTLPPAMPLSALLYVPRKRSRSHADCSCGNPGKYCCPKTSKRFCSISCYKQL